MRSVRQDNSRCARLRSSTAACGKCIAACPVAAVDVTTSVRIDSRACTNCGSCVAACPTEALRWDAPLSFGRILARVARRERSVIGCTASTTPGRIDAGDCLGWLGEEHLCALTSVALSSLQIDLSLCAACRNAHVAEALERRVESAQRRGGLPVRDRIILVTEAGRCWPDADAVDRRQLFGLWREFVHPELDGFPVENDFPLTYGRKALPEKRKILKWVADRHGDAVAGSMSSSYHGRLEIGSACDGCGACVAVCPCAALEQQDEDGPPVAVSSRCVACGACELFCSASAIRVPGAEERNPLPERPRTRFRKEESR